MEGGALVSGSYDKTAPCINGTKTYSIREIVNDAVWTRTDTSFMVPIKIVETAIAAGDAATYETDSEAKFGTFWGATQQKTFTSHVTDYDFITV